MGVLTNKHGFSKIKLPQGGSMQNKIDIFYKEICYIKNERYRENIKKMIEWLPDYFFEVPASSTGKYHPKFSLGKMGLVRHTKAAVRIAYELLNTNTIGYSFKEDEKDLMLMALILHDGFKHGIQKSEYVIFDHPLVMANYIKEHKNNLTLNEEEIDLICKVIACHMGEWNTNNYSNVVLPVPKNKYERFVHMCDFLASRKFLNMEFENNEIVE